MSENGRAKRGIRFLLAIPILSLLLFGAFSSSPVLQSSNPQQASPQPLLSNSTPLVAVTPINVAQLAVGSQFTIQVVVRNMAQFNGWDIQVYAYNFIINATSLSISGNDFQVNASSGTPFEIVHCVNGQGTGCTSKDGPGYVHSAYGNTAALSGNGLLFSITYKVLGVGYSPTALVNVLISSPASGNGDPHTDISGAYSMGFGNSGASGVGKVLDS